MTYEEELDMLRDMWILGRKFSKTLTLYLIVLGKTIEQAERNERDSLNTGMPNE